MKDGGWSNMGVMWVKKVIYFFMINFFFYVRIGLKNICIYI